MRQDKRARLAAAGWRIGDEADFLELTREERELVELRIALAHYARALRTSQGLTQAQVAVLLGSSQSRVAKLEAADVSVSLDLMVKVVIALGATREQLGAAVATGATGLGF